MTSMCLKRLKKERERLDKGDYKHLFLCVPESDKEYLTWHYVLFGQKDTDFEGGVFHGIILFPTEYPYKPPSFKMFTPNGRFEVGKKLCMSNTSYHTESWSPFWTLSTLLNGLLSFMNEDSPGIGSIQKSKATRRKLAKESMAFNLKSDLFVRLFPEVCQRYLEQLRQKKQLSQRVRRQGVSQSSSSGSGSDSDSGRLLLMNERNNGDTIRNNESANTPRMDGMAHNLQTRIQDLAIQRSWKTESIFDWLIIAVAILGIGFALTLIL